MTAIPSFADPPFGCPDDITLDLPPAPSVNATRRVDWRSAAGYAHWKKSAGNCVLAARCKTTGSIRGKKIAGRFEAIIILDETQSKIDLDNAVKAILDFAKNSDLITDDSPKYLRQLTVKFGEAPLGVRLILKPME